jgi:hypothetical protein
MTISDSIFILVVNVSVSGHAGAVWNIPGLHTDNGGVRDQAAVHTLHAAGLPHPHGRGVLPRQAHVHPRHQCKTHPLICTWSVCLFTTSMFCFQQIYER